MEKITEIIFECESITPMFMYGADGKTPEVTTCFYQRSDEVLVESYSWEFVSK